MYSDLQRLEVAEEHDKYRSAQKEYPDYRIYISLTDPILAKQYLTPRASTSVSVISLESSVAAYHNGSIPEYQLDLFVPSALSQGIAYVNPR